MNMSQMLVLCEDFNLPVEADSFDLLRNNLEHLKDLQKLYTWQQSYAGLNHTPAFSQWFGLFPLNLPEPPKHLNQLLTMDAIQVFQRKYCRLVYSTDNFNQYPAFTHQVSALLYTYNKHEHLPYLHKAEDEIWFTTFGCSTPISRIFIHGAIATQYHHSFEHVHTTIINDLERF